MLGAYCKGKHALMFTETSGLYLAIMSDTHVFLGNLRILCTFSGMVACTSDMLDWYSVREVRLQASRWRCSRPRSRPTNSGAVPRVFPRTHGCINGDCDAELGASLKTMESQLSDACYFLEYGYPQSSRGYHRSFGQLGHLQRIDFSRRYQFCLKLNNVTTTTLHARLTDTLAS